MAVSFSVLAGEDMLEELQFYSDPVAVPPATQTYDDPKTLLHPEMDVRNHEALVVHLSTVETADGVLTVSDTNKLTIQINHLATKRFPVKTLRFDVFDDIGGSRQAILRGGSIAVEGSATMMSS